MFAFDSGQELSEHSAPFDAVVHVIEGEGSFLIGGEEVSYPLIMEDTILLVFQICML